MNEKSTPSAATTDPDELLEVFDAAGEPTGVAKTRAAIHADGDWHLAFFCWIVRESNGGLGGVGEVEVVLQRRAPHKDVWPGHFDASAAGHVRFGETLREASREIEEELGLRVDPAQLEPLTRHRQEHVHESGIVDREIHDVYVLRCDTPLEDYRPGPEVTGLVAVPVAHLVELACGTRPSLATTLVQHAPDGATSHEPITLRRDDLVPYDVGYWEKIAHSGRASMARR